MNKICTSLEQSKKLVKLGINVNTADMYYPNRIGMDNYPLPIEWKNGLPLLSQEIPAWSLSALLELMPIETHLYKMQDEDNYTKHYYKVGSFDGKGWIELNNTLAIDAVYEMICWLLENKKL